MRTNVDAAMIQSELDILFDPKSTFTSICETCLSTSTFVKTNIITTLKNKIETQRNEISTLTSKISVLENDIKNPESQSVEFNDDDDVITTGIMNRFKTFKDSMAKSLETHRIDIAIEIGKISDEISKSIQKTIQEEFEKMKRNNDADSTTNANKKELIEKVSIKPVNGVYAIHVSKFAKDTKIDDIISLITGKTDINSDSFSVEFSSNRKQKKNKFVNFKISTLKKEICDKLVNDSIWSPNYTVKQFEIKQNSNRKT